MSMGDAIRRWLGRLRAVGWGAIAFALLGLLFLGLGLSDLMKLVEARRWPTAPGHIVRSEIRTTRDPGGEPIYFLSVAYQYSYAGRLYTGTRVSFGDSFDEATRNDTAHARASWLTRTFTGGQPVYGDADRGVVEYHARGFPLGKQVVVHVDPSEPARAVIDVEPTWYNTRFLFRACVMFAIAAVLAVLRWVRTALRPR